MNAESVKTQILYVLSVIRIGKLLVRAATVAPNPNVTSAMGRAQQTNVPVEANKDSQVNLR